MENDGWLVTLGFPSWRTASLYCIRLIKLDEYAGFSWHSNSGKLWIMTSLKIAHNADNNGVRNIRHRYYTADMKHLCASLLKLVLQCNGYAVRCFSFGTEPLATYIYAVPKENGDHFNSTSRYLLMVDCKRTDCKVLSVRLVENKAR